LFLRRSPNAQRYDAEMELDPDNLPDGNDNGDW
jgi:hypothetical protein